MKTIRRNLALVGCALLASFLVGCMTPAQKEWTCATAQAAYASYQSVIEAGHKPSQNEVYAATAAATFLRLWCGWVPDYTEKTAACGAPVVDENWVPKIVP